MIMILCLSLKIVCDCVNYVTESDNRCTRYTASCYRQGDRTREDFPKKRFPRTSYRVFVGKSTKSFMLLGA